MTGDLRPINNDTAATSKQTATESKKAEQAQQQAYVGFFGDVYGACVNSFSSQANGFVQLSNRVLGTELSELKPVQVDSPESSWSAWSASLIGQSGAMAAELFVGRKLGGAARVLQGKESAAAVIAGTESASSKMYSSFAFGAVMGGVFTPTNDSEHFWSDRLKNMTSSTVSIGTMSSVSLSIERKAATLGDGLLKSTLSNGYLNTGVGGFIGGSLGDMTSSALNGKAPETTTDYWKHVARAGSEFALVGMGTNALGTGTAGAHESANKLGVYRALTASWDAANMAVGRGVPLKRYAGYLGADPSLASQAVSSPFAGYRVHVDKAAVNSIDHESKRIDLNKLADSKSSFGVPMADPAALAHELGHGDIKSNAGISPSESDYIGWRLTREVNARVAEKAALAHQGRLQEANALTVDPKKILLEQTGGGSTYDEQYRSDYRTTGGDKAKPFIEYKGKPTDATGQTSEQQRLLNSKLERWKDLDSSKLRPLFDRAVEENRYADEFLLGVRLRKYYADADVSGAATKYEKVRTALAAEANLNAQATELSPKEFKLLSEVGKLTGGRATVNQLLDGRSQSVKQMADSIISVHAYSTDGLSVSQPQFFQIENWITDEARARSEARNPGSKDKVGNEYSLAQSLLKAGITDEGTARKIGAMADGVREYHNHQHGNGKIYPSWSSTERETFGFKMEPSRLQLLMNLPGIETWSPSAMAVAYHTIGKPSASAKTWEPAEIESAKEAWAVDARMPLSIAKIVGAASVPDRLAASIALDQVLEGEPFRESAQKMAPKVKYVTPTRANRRTVNSTNRSLRDSAFETGARLALDSGAADAQFFATWEHVKSAQAGSRELVSDTNVYSAVDAAVQLISENGLFPQQRAKLVQLASGQPGVFKDLATMDSAAISEAFTHLEKQAVKITESWRVEDRDHELTSPEAWLLLKTWSRLTSQQRELPVGDLVLTTQSIDALNLAPSDVKMLERVPQFADWLAKDKKNDEHPQPANRSIAVLRTWAQLGTAESAKFASWLQSNYPGESGAEPYVDQVIAQWTKLSETERSLPIGQQLEVTKLLADLTPQRGLSAQLKIPRPVSDQIAQLKPWEQIAAIRAWREETTALFKEQPWDKQSLNDANAVNDENESLDVNQWNATVTSPEWQAKFEARLNELRGLGRNQILAESDDAYRILQTYSPNLEPAFLQMISSAFKDVAHPAQYMPRIQGEQYKQVLSRLIGDHGAERIAKLATLDEFSAATDKFVYRSAIRTSWENDATIKLLTTFGKQWSRWLDLQAKPTQDKENNVVFAGRDVHDASIIAPLAAPADSQTLSQWLFRFYDRPGEEIGVVATRWSLLTAAEREATYKDTVSAAKKYVYANRNDESFAVEAAKWGVPDSQYAAFEKRYLNSLDKPTPFPLDKTWTYEPDPEHPNGLTARFLPRNDPRAVFIGGHTNCCQHPLGAGASAAWYGQESPHAGHFVVEDKASNLVAASLVWESTKGGLVFDSIESKGSGSNEPSVAKLYELAAQDLRQKYPTINVGAGTHAGRKGVDLNRWPNSNVTLLQIDKDIYTDAAVQRTIAAASGN